MKRSQLFTKTHKEDPRDEESKGARLLVRAGFVHKEMAGVYSWLPLGLRVLQRIEQIVREEMNAIGATELQMTTLQPKELWEKTGRWSDAEVDVWFKTKLFNGTELGLAPTHEEPMTNIVRQFAQSYKDLPVLAYQFQWKMRNELRAKSGVMRGREFRMKDLYSFAATKDQHDEIYERVKGAYHKVYERLGIAKDTYYTFASGGMFSRFSHEFQTILDVGEDTIHIDDQHRIAVNDELMQDIEAIQEAGFGNAKLRAATASEVGNIFPLGTKYSEPIGATYTDENGNVCPMIMGSYGIGVSRLVGVLAEYFADEKGLVWHESVAPAQVYLVQVGDEPATAKAAQALYEKLEKTGVSVLYDDRDVSAGEKFADADLIGLPVRLTVSPKTLEAKKIEYKSRTAERAELLTESVLLKKLTA